jgi:hypothetical protein
VKLGKNVYFIILSHCISGNLLGLEDRFNLALYANRALYQKIYNEIAIGSLKTSDLSAANAQLVFGSAVGSLMCNLITTKSMMFFGLSSLPEFKGEQLWNCMSFWDMFSLYLLKLGAFLTYHYESFRKLGNYLFLWRVKSVKEKLNRYR